MIYRGYMLLQAQTSAIHLQAKLFRGFGDVSRLSILATLRNRPLTVTEIIEVTGLSQSNTSNHLSCLKDCGLVVSHQEGRRVIYELSDPRIAQLLDLADLILADVAQGVYACTHYSTEKE